MDPISVHLPKESERGMRKTEKTREEERSRLPDPTWSEEGRKRGEYLRREK